jgi:hypothetical protein
MSDRRRTDDETLRNGHLGGQRSTQGTLLLQGTGRGTFALLRGRQSSLDGGDYRSERGVGRGHRRNLGCVSNERTSGEPRGVGERSLVRAPVLVG